jgi:DNA-binding transcriptional LysR family regulator
MTDTNLRNFDLNLLVVFDSVYSAGNISHAAKQLSLTQPAVSNALARLRERFDDPLFVREGRNMKPTLRSRQMIGAVRDALQLVRRQLGEEAAIDLATYKRLFRVVILDALEPFLVPPLANAIDASAPGITIDSRPAGSTHVVNELIGGTLDVAFYTYQASAPGVIMVPVCPVEAVVVARRDHPRIRGKLDVETFMACGHVTFINEMKSLSNIERDIAHGAGARRVPFMANTLWSIAAIAGKTDLLGILPRRLAEELASGFNLAIHAPPAKIAEQHLYMMWHERNQDDIGHRWLRQLLTEAVQATFGEAPKAAS